MEFSYGFVRQLFEPVVATAGAEDRAAFFSGAAAPAQQVLAPSPEAASSADVSFGMLHSLFWLTVNVAARGPILLAVDDLHWCDLPSLRFISYLVRRLEGLPISIAGSTRLHEVAADDASAVLREVASDSLTTVVRPAPLSAESVAQIVARSAAEPAAPEFAAAVHSASDGNPLIVRELLVAAREEGVEPTRLGAARIPHLAPDVISRSVSRRLARLEPSAPRLAQALAVLGEEGELRQAAELAELDLPTAVQAADALTAVEILRPGGGMAFTHPVLRAAVSADLGAFERGRLHARAADILSRDGAGAQQIAAHLLFVPPQGNATNVATLREAADRSLADSAPDAAAAFLRRALEEPPDPQLRSEVVLELGLALARAHATEAVRYLGEALEARKGEGRAAPIAIELSHALYAAGRTAEAVAILDRTIADLEQSDGAEIHALEGELIALGRWETALYPRVIERLHRIRGGIRDDTFGGRLLLAILSSEETRRGTSPEKARDFAERALAGGVLLRHPSWLAFVTAANTFLALGEHERAIALYDQWLQVARNRGSVAAFVPASTFRGLAELRRGSLVEAEAYLRDAAEAISLYSLGRGFPFATGYLAETLLERGRAEDALRVLAAAGLDRAVPENFQFSMVLHVRGRVRVAKGLVEQGLSDLLEAGRRLTALGWLNPSQHPWRSHAAAALLVLRRRDEAAELARDELARAEAWGAIPAVGIALRTAALVAGGGEREELLRRSVSVLEDSQAQLERARSLIELGAMLRRANRRGDARSFLEQGRELAYRCGAEAVAERAHEELLALGARPRRVALTGVDALTPSERRVAQMAATGRANREIAQELFVTPKTVEMHLSRVYRKLGIHSRSQLTRELTGSHS